MKRALVTWAPLGAFIPLKCKDCGSMFYRKNIEGSTIYADSPRAEICKFYHKESDLIPEPELWNKELGIMKRDGGSISLNARHDKEKYKYILKMTRVANRDFKWKVNEVDYPKLRDFVINLDADLLLLNGGEFEDNEFKVVVNAIKQFKEWEVRVNCKL